LPHGTIFFLVAFHTSVLSRALTLREYGVKVSAVAGATVGALLVGEVVLIGDHVPFVNRFPEKPLIYNVAWKTVIYVSAPWWCIAWSISSRSGGCQPLPAEGGGVASLLGHPALAHRSALRLVRTAGVRSRGWPTGSHEDVLRKRAVATGDARVGIAGIAGHEAAAPRSRITLTAPALSCTTLAAE
jgi:hypothetical protein